jgi:protein tyrosine/serine phosphatase
MRRTLVIVFLMLLPPLAAGTYSELRRQARYPNRFAEVSPGAIYRGGRPTAEHIEHLVADQSIRTILSLTDTTNRPEEKQAQAVADRLRLHMLRVPMPGNGVGDLDELERAADLLADQSSWPIYFHCAAGKQRSNAVLAAYRLKYCGRTVDQVLAELQERYDLDPVDESALIRHIREFAARLDQRARASAIKSAGTAPGAAAPKNPFTGKVD